MRSRPGRSGSRSWRRRPLRLTRACARDQDESHRTFPNRLWCSSGLSTFPMRVGPAAGSYASAAAATARWWQWTHGLGEDAIRGYLAANPPLLCSSCPVIQPPAGESRKPTRSAVSCGVPRRPAGVCLMRTSRSSSSIQPVSMGPGLMALAEIPRSASSMAAAMTMRSRAPLLEPYGRLWAVWSLVSATTRPALAAPTWAGSCSANALMRSQGARALTA